MSIAQNVQSLSAMLVPLTADLAAKNAAKAAAETALADEQSKWSTILADPQAASDAAISAKQSVVDSATAAATTSHTALCQVNDQIRSELAQLEAQV